MEFNFNKIKNLMQGDAMQPLPPELDWDNMKDGIFDKIQSIQQEESSQGNNTYSMKRIGLSLSLLFLLTLGPFSIAHKMIKNQDTEATDVAQLSKRETYKSASNNLGEAAPTNQTKRSGQLLVDLVEKNQKTNIKDLLLANKESESNQYPKKLERAQMDSDQLLKYQHLNENNPQNNFLDTDRVVSAESTLNITQDALTPLPETVPPISMPQISNLKALPTDIFNQISLEEIKQPILDIQKKDSVYLPSIHHSKSPNLFILEGGITFWDEGYGNNMPERAQYETPLTSFQLQGYYMKSFGRNYFVMAGLQYQQLESRFHYNKTIQDYKISIKDTIIQVQNNLLSGQQTIIYGDVEKSVQAERRVRHYNTTKLFKVSAAIGKTWRFNSFQTDIYLGGALNSLVHNQGRTVDQDTIINYNGSSNSLFQNQLTLDATFGVRLHYFLNQNIGLTTGFQTQKSLMNWSNQTDINFYPLSFGLQLGLSYSLK